MANNNVRIDARAFSRKLDDIARRSNDGRRIKNIAKEAAQPWKKVAKEAIYSKLDRRTGGLKRGITVRQLKKSVGVVAGANFKSKGGWKAHFFRKGTGVVSPSKQIDYQARFATRTREVKRKFREGLINFVFKR